MLATEMPRITATKMPCCPAGVMRLIFKWFLVYQQTKEAIAL
jgi:hypothetical protein